MYRFSVRSLVLLHLLVFTLMGCRNKLTPGHYEGNLVWGNYFGINGQPVGIDVSYSGRSGSLNRRGQLEILDSRGNHLTSIIISHLSEDKFDLNVPAIYSQPFHLKKLKSDNKERGIACFLDQGALTAELCLDKQRVQLKILNGGGAGIFKLLGEMFTKEAKFTLESPQEFSLDQAIQRALASNLDARIGFEKVIQAKYSATAAYLNLIPHLTTNLIWNAEPGFISTVATLQGLAPFLLPTYWLQARESQYDLKIKTDSETILKADLAAMAEQLSYAYARDHEIVQIQENVLASLKNFIDQVSERELQGQVSAGSTQSLVSIANKITSDKEKAQQLVKEDQYTLSQALGFHNPEAVARIYVPALDYNRAAPRFQKDQVADTASRRSFEIRQLDYLKKITQLKKIELYFAWIDPTGDPKSGFGFNTIAQVKVSKSQQRELDLCREQLKQTIYQNTYRIVDQYNSTIDFVNQLRTQHAYQDLDAALRTSLQGEIISEKIAILIESNLSNQIGQVANIFAYRIARSKIDRTLLSGYYQFLLPALDQTEAEFNALM